MNGEGEIFYKNGDYFRGTFLEGLRCGYGEFLYNSGDFYKGNWVDGKMNGSANCRCKGEVVKGVWKNNQYQPLELYEEVKKLEVKNNGLNDPEIKKTIRNVKWEGTQTYRGETHDFVIDNFVNWIDDTLYGTGHDIIGDFTLEGAFLDIHNINFEKTYFRYNNEDAQNNNKKIIVYDGVQDDDRVIKGTWKVKDDLNNSFWK